MIDLAYKNITRQKTRVILTMIGITIGIAAIVALGSISEGINKMIEEELEFMGGTIMVYEKDAGGLMGMEGSEITKEEIEQLRDVSGVEDVIPFTFKIGKIIPGQGIQETIMGINPEDIDYFIGLGMTLDSGRELESGDTFHVMLGYVHADSNELEIGDYLEIKDEEFEIVGILEEMGNEDDNSIMMPLDTMMDLYNMDYYGGAIVVPEDVAKVESVSENIESDFEDLEASSSKEIASQMSSVVDTLRVFTLGIGSIAAIVGGLGVMNTMIMSVMERRREIGIMKAVGATRKFIITQILTESLMISLIGGIIGLLFGVLINYGLRALSGSNIVKYTQVTPGLAVGSLFFVVFLGIIGGLYPAWSASKVDPIEALRYE